MTSERVPLPPSQLSLFDAVRVLADTPAAIGVPEAPTQASMAPGSVSWAPAPLQLARHPRANREAHLDGHVVGYEFRRMRRKTIGLVIGAEGLVVSAPRWVPWSEVEATLQEKARWVLRKLREQDERAQRLAAQRVDWRDGTSLPFLGEMLIVVLDPRTSGIVLHSATDTLPGIPRLTLHVGLPQHAQAAQIRDAVQSWLQRQARRVFEERCTHFAARLGVRWTRLSLSSAATRWGSASEDGAIRLHWRLVHFAMPTIDYVVAHELAHLRVMDHSPRFWDVVRSVIPDVDRARDTLRDDALPPLD
jgi:predicted metal-dependent hydrolase